jgi:hypothetical protein
MTNRLYALALFGAFATTLMIVAWASPPPDHVTDRGVYERTAAETIVPDCSDLHCFRVLVPWVLGRLPGSSIVRWKVYAAVANAGAGAAVFLLCAACGFSRRMSMIAAVLSATGFGSMYTLHDCYTSDPLMFAAGPLLMRELLQGRLAIAAIAASVGVVAKEFAAAPAYVVSAYYAVERRWLDAAQTLAAANVAFIVWITLTLTLMIAFNYSWGGTDSAKVAAGAGIGPWLQRLGPRGIASAMFNEFGALYVLAPAGFLLAPRQLRRLALVSMPVAAVFAYVQQPDRALWNFHFLVTPFAALVLDRVPAALAWGTIGLFAIGNLRVGAQLPIAGVGRAALLVSILAAAIDVAAAFFQRTPMPQAQQA